MRIMLFTTPTCQYCAPAKDALSTMPNVEIIDATENMELAVEFGIRSVPTLIVSKCSGTESFVGLDKILEFVKAKQGTGCGCGCNH